MPPATLITSALRLHDGTLPGVEAALTPALIAQLLSAAWGPGGETLLAADASLTYVRYKPGTSLLAGYRFSMPDGPLAPLVLGYGKLVPPARLEEARSKALAIAHNQSGARVLVLDPLPLLFHVFPFDRAVTGLRHVMNRDKLKRVARAAIDWPSPAYRVSGKRSSLGLVGWKPERRVVVSAVLGVIDESAGHEAQVAMHVKAYADETGATSAGVGTWLTASAARSATADAPHFAATRGYDAALRIFFQECVAGQPLDPGDTTAADATGRALAWLHRLPAPPADVLAGLAHRAPHVPAALRRDAQHQMHYISALSDRSFGGPARATCARLDVTQPAAAATGLVHGDFHPQQVMTHRGRVALLDMDRTALGDPRADLGTFVAGLRLAALRDPQVADAAAAGESAFLRGYREASSADRMEGWQWFAAASLVRQASLPFRTLQPDWPDAVLRILCAAEDLL